MPLAGNATANYTIDTTEPVVTITRDDADPTNATSVDFSVDFSEDVTNVDVADFALDVSGVTANILSVGDAGDADASTYTVTVDTIVGEGTIGLDIKGGNDIVDLPGNAVNTTPVTDQLYTVDTINDAPTLGATAVNPAFTEGSGNADLFSGVTISTVESWDTVDELQFTVTNVTDGVDEMIVIDGENITLTDLNSGTTIANGYGYSISLSGTTATVILTTIGATEAPDEAAYRSQKFVKCVQSSCPIVCSE